MITQETAARIYNIYHEIEAGKKILEDMEQISKEQGLDKYEPTLEDAFGRRRHLQLGIPHGENGHRLLQVTPVLAQSVIRCHIEKKRAELAELNEIAKLEASQPCKD